MRKRGRQAERQRLRQRTDRRVQNGGKKLVVVGYMFTI